MKTEIKMPSLKEGMKSGILCAWSVEEGELVHKGDVLFEVEVDKVVSEVTAEEEMEITSLLAEDGDEVTVGDTVALAEVIDL